jgi:hypothetical protein
MGAVTKERAKDRVAEVSRRGCDLVTFWRECTEVLVAAVPHYNKPCWYTLDPASLLIRCSSLTTSRDFATTRRASSMATRSGASRFPTSPQLAGEQKP